MDQIQVNENFLKISHYKKDWIPVEGSLPLDQDITLKITAQVSGYELITNNDGSADRVYQVKGLLAEQVEHE